MRKLKETELCRLWKTSSHAVWVCENGMTFMSSKLLPLKRINFLNYEETSILSCIYFVQVQVRKCYSYYS